MLTFDQARDQISDKVFTDKRRDEFQKYLVKLRAQAIIDWRNADVKKAYRRRAGATGEGPGGITCAVIDAQPQWFARSGPARAMSRLSANNWNGSASRLFSRR